LHRLVSHGPQQNDFLVEDDVASAGRRVTAAGKLVTQIKRRQRRALIVVGIYVQLQEPM
jgi:hypothetical protein